MIRAPEYEALDEVSSFLCRSVFLSFSLSRSLVLARLRVRPNHVAFTYAGAHRDALFYRIFIRKFQRGCEAVKLLAARTLPAPLRDASFITRINAAKLLGRRRRRAVKNFEVF